MDNSPPHKRSRRSNSPLRGSKRSRLPPPPLSIGVGNVLFRLLCPMPLAGGVIGKSGAIVKRLQTFTSSKIRVEESPPGAEDRVIVIIASKIPSKKISLTGEEGDGGTEVVEVSAAQEAVIRVFERMVEVMEEEDEGDAPGDTGMVKCQLLAEKSQVGGVIGKGGKVIEKIRKDTQCKVSVWKDRNFPSCALPDEELLEMEGNVLAVKRAVLAITGRLQECPPLETARLGGSWPYQATSDAPYRMPPSYYPHASRDRYSTEMSRVPALDHRSKQEEVVLRILCPNDRIGGVIGRGGKIINALQDETGAAITAKGSVPGCDERLITITAKENPESQFSPTQNALVLVFNRIVEAGFEKGIQSPSNKFASAKVAVLENQLECLLVNGGAVISDIRMTTGANIRILEHHQIPELVKEKAEVVEITGEFVNVQDALFKVTNRLRQNLSLSKTPNDYRVMANSGIPGPYERAKDPNLGSVGASPMTYSGFGSLYERAKDPNLGSVGVSHMTNSGFGVIYKRAKDPNFGSVGVSPMTNPGFGDLYGRAKDPNLGLLKSVGVSPTVNPPTVLSHSMGHLGLPHGYQHPPTSMSWAPQELGGVNSRGTVVAGSGLPSVKGGVELGSGSRAAVVTNTTVEIAVSNDAINSVYGENGSNLARLGQISGAKIAVHEPRPGTSDWTIVVSGTPNETQAAQSLVQAFILTGKPNEVLTLCDR